jgi:hypothetical protein
VINFLVVIISGLGIRVSISENKNKQTNKQTIDAFQYERSLITLTCNNVA